jgi:hypothetical protein
MDFQEMSLLNFHINLSIFSNFDKSRKQVTCILHEEQHAFQRNHVTSWGNPCDDVTTELVRFQTRLTQRSLTPDNSDVTDAIRED